VESSGGNLDLHIWSYGHTGEQEAYVFGLKPVQKLSEREALLSGFVYRLVNETRSAKSNSAADERVAKLQTQLNRYAARIKQLERDLATARQSDNNNNNNNMNHSSNDQDDFIAWGPMVKQGGGKRNRAKSPQSSKRSRDLLNPTQPARRRKKKAIVYKGLQSTQTQNADDD